MYTPTEQSDGVDGCHHGLTDPSHTSPQPALPPAPRPSADVGMKTLPTTAGSGLDASSQQDQIDIFTMSPVVALKMLCRSIEEMVHITGDIPPTPPVSLPTTPKASFLQSNEDTSRHRSGSDDHDVPSASKTPIGSPEAHPTEPFHIVGSHSEPLHVQDSALTRKFYSKRPPPISLEEYLLRLHRYCPMSTAVYLATSLYIHRLTVVERIIPVTGRNAHRLLLAGLRVAMKALEDLSYPHRRFAKVGGVSEPELGRLEVSFCFLTDFELKVSHEMLHKQAAMLRDGAKFRALPEGFQPVLPVKRRMTIRSILPETSTGISTTIAGGCGTT
ncbi:hypothetical protein MMC19_005410 [Ptychographa xylographoides]|nr:hypothetical protein [Ptychographa xylographoides]